MEIYITRHTPVANEDNLCYGQSDIPLRESVTQDLAQLIEKLPKAIDVVFSSPLERCKLLTTALNHKNTIYSDALMEMNFGAWESKKWDAINQEELNHWMSDFVQVKPPEGENLIELFERVKLFLDKLRLEKHEKVLLVTHAGVMRCIWAYLLNIPLHNIFKIPVDFGQLLTIKMNEDPNFDSIKKIH